MHVQQMGRKQLSSPGPAGTHWASCSRKGVHKLIFLRHIANLLPIGDPQSQPAPTWMAMGREQRVTEGGGVGRARRGGDIVRSEEGSICQHGG